VRVGPKLEQNAVRAVLLLFTAITVFILLFIVVFILRKGLPVVDLSFLSQNPVDMGRAGGIFSTIVGTLVLTAVAVVIAGIGTAIFLTEYTWENRVTRIIRFGADCLAGIPSIIFGLFGFILFVTKLRFGWSILSGGLTLAFMILPTIIRTSEEAIRAVPASLLLIGFFVGAIIFLSPAVDEEMSPPVALLLQNANPLSETITLLDDTAENKSLNVIFAVNERAAGRRFGP